MVAEIFVEGEDYPAVKVDAEEIVQDKATEAASRAFGIQYLFPWQKLVVANILDADETVRQQKQYTADNGTLTDVEDIGDDICRGRQIVLLPTGAGKSLCFLTPALLLKGPTLVLYPLLALMADQQRRMEAGALKCVVFKGGQSEQEREENFKELQQGAQIILANPEVLQNEQLVERLSKCSISHIAIDEAHCVSEWGDSFRPAYLTLGAIIKKLGCQVVTAFTATASPPILSRISQVLFDNDCHIIQASSDRQNIHYSVEYAYAKRKAVLKLAKTNKKPMIVFCSSRRKTEQMAQLLNEYFGNGLSKFYHAGMTKEEKNNIEKWFFDSNDGILCATCAYGMGVDKSNIQTVIHLDAPEHLENFIQEAGRGGRNGDNVKSILVWSHWDTVRHRQFAPGSREKAMGDFALSTACRREFMLDYLNDHAERSGCAGCDVCDKNRRGEKIEITARDSQKVVDFINKNPRLYTKAEAKVLVRQQFNREDLKEFRINIWEEKDMTEIFNQLLSERKIVSLGGLWKNHLEVRSKYSSLTSRLIRWFSPLTRHRLHYFRRRWRHLQEGLQQVLALT